jgi:superfamily II DNA helicase RecQ
LLEVNKAMFDEIGIPWRIQSLASSSVVVGRTATKTPQAHCGWKDDDAHDVKVRCARMWLSDNVGVLRICVENNDAEWRADTLDVMAETIVVDALPVNPNHRQHILQLQNCGAGKTTCLTGMALINQHFVPLHQSLVTVVVYANVTLMTDAFALMSRIGVNVVKGRTSDEIRRHASEMVGSGMIVTVIDTFVHIAQDSVVAMMNDGTIRRIYFDEAHELVAQSKFRPIFGQFASVAKSSSFSRINWTLMSGTFPTPIQEVVCDALGIAEDEITTFSSTSGYSLTSVSIQTKDSQSKTIAMYYVVDECCKSSASG